MAIDEHIQRGLALFNAAEFFECHEVLEEAWTPEREPRRTFLQALIHFAVAFHHAQRGNLEGARGQLRKGLRKLAPYRPACEGIDTEALFAAAAAALEQIEAGTAPAEYPKIRRCASTARLPAGADRAAH